MIRVYIHNHITAVNDGIRKRDPENRCPTMQEVDMLRKLLNMTTVIQKQHTGADFEHVQSVQITEDFRDNPWRRRAKEVVLLGDRAEAQAPTVVGHVRTGRFVHAARSGVRRSARAPGRWCRGRAR